MPKDIWALDAHLTIKMDGEEPIHIGQFINKGKSGGVSTQYTLKSHSDAEIAKRDERIKELWEALEDVIFQELSESFKHSGISEPCKARSLEIIDIVINKLLTKHKQTIEGVK